MTVDAGFAQRVLEDMLKSVIDMHIENMKYIKERADVDKHASNFDGFWKTFFAQYQKMFGEEKAKQFQTDIIKYHHLKTRDLTGNAAYATSAKFVLGWNLDNADYNQIIVSYEKELKESRVLTERLLLDSADIIRD
jgi:hypothetical protein